MRNFILGYVLIAGLAAASTVSAQDRAQSGDQLCIEVQIGEDTSSHLGCLNKVFEKTVAHEHAAFLPQAPFDARSSTNALGLYNDAAAREMMGDQFGVSARQQRPRSVFGSPLIPSMPR